MGKEEQIFGFVTVFVLVYTKAQNASFIPLPPIVLPLSCMWGGTKYNIGDEWKPDPFTTCTCVGPSSVSCSRVMPCFDHQNNQRQPGDRWLEDPTTNCTCTDAHSVMCQKLDEPACMDASGHLRKNRETWISSSCVDCSCNNGSVKCNRYDVNVTYGLYSVTLFPTCETCDVPSRAVGRFSTCNVYRELSSKKKLLECASEGFYIRDTQRCNRIRDCPDGSDEKNCDNVLCKDEEGNSFLIKDDSGWRVSRCMTCYCKNGLLSCRRTLTVNFPGYFVGFYDHNENCTQPQCNVAKFLREKKNDCEGVEFIRDDGIYLKGASWKYEGCDFYFPGAHLQLNACPSMARPACYVYNGAICCGSDCPVAVTATGKCPFIHFSGLQEIAYQLRGNLSFCSNGRQLVTKDSHCKNSNHCLQNFYIQNCSSEITCQDEDLTQYFEGATWSAGECMQCSCKQGTIHCSRKVVLASFLIFTQKLQVASEVTFTEQCNQNDCNVANFMRRNNRVCHACKWNNKLYYEGDHWKENSVDFYCSSSNQKVTPGCYVENRHVICTGAIPGIRELSLLSNDDLFLCDSGDEFISLGDTCNIRADCHDRSDERDCDHYYCAPEKSLGFLWNRTQVDGEILKQCSIIHPEWTGEFGSKCTSGSYHTVWLHKNTCECERKTLLEYFKEKIADVNESNFMNVSQAIATSAQAGNFTNPKAFHDMFKDIFYIVTRILTPLTLQNADEALKYCEHFIQTLLWNPVYTQSFPFCMPRLADDRNILVDKALEFLRQAPRNTTAYNVGSSLQVHRAEDRGSGVKENFNTVKPALGITREQLILQLNTVQRLPRNVDKLTPLISDKNDNVSKEHGTNIKSIEPTGENKTNELSNQEIKEALRANNCTSVKFDEEKGVFIYSQDVSKETLKQEEIQSKMELVLICISISAVIIALILLTTLRLKRSERLFIHKSLLLSLGLGNLIFVVDKNLFASRHNHEALCSAATIIQFFFHTSLFTWMLVEGINLYIKLVKVFSVRSQYIPYVAIGWGIPVGTVGLVAAIKPSTFDMGKTQYEYITCGTLKLSAEVLRNRCWINGSLWIYKGPILVILVANMVLFGIILRVIFGKISSKYGEDHIKIAKRGLRSIVALLPLLGVTWLLGFFIEFHTAVGYLFILLNSTQGVVFFIFHCVLDDQVQDAIRKLYAKKIADSRTRTTPLSNPNDETQTIDATMKNGTQHNETPM